MIDLRRPTGVVGLLIFATAFFLPPGYYNSPQGRFSWAFEAIFLAGSAGEKLAFIGICLAIAYPYLWALLTALFLLHRSPSRPAVIGQFILHLVGAIPIIALGWTLIRLQSEFPDRGLQLLAVLAPAAFLLLLGVAAKMTKLSRRLPALTVVALLLFVPLQLIILYFVRLDGGAWWGYLLGASGAVLALAGCSGLFGWR